MTFIRVNGSGSLGPAVANALFRVNDQNGRDLKIQHYSQNTPYDEFPDVIVHTSWQTNVDRCTTHPRESRFICMKGFDEAVKMHRRYGSHLIFISSAYVFSGDCEEPYRVDDREHMNPVNHYGRLKLEAEEKLHATSHKYKMAKGERTPHYAIFRTDALYDNHKSYNYPAGATDQISNPTYTDFLAKVVAKYAHAMVREEHLDSNVLSKNVFHVVGPEVMNRYEFIKQFSNDRVKPCLMGNLDLPATRPVNTSLEVSNDLLDELNVHNVTVEAAKSYVKSGQKI